MKAAIINSSNIVINIIVTDEPYNPGGGETAILIADDVFVSIGWIYDWNTKTFIDPNPLPPRT